MVVGVVAGVAGEPYRLLLHAMMAALDRLIAGDESLAYRAADYVADLRLIRDGLTAGGLEGVAREGLLPEVLVQARTFGFHMAALDVRQHSRVHEAAVADLLRVAGVEADYARLDEDARQALLVRELRTPRPLRPLARRCRTTRASCWTPWPWCARRWRASRKASAATSSP